MTTYRIVIVISTAAFGGVEKMRLKLARHWLEHGHSVRVVFLYKFGELLDEFVSLLGSKNIFFLLPPNARQLACVLPMARLLRRLAPDITIVSCWPLTVYSLLSSLLVLSGAKIIVCEHTSISHAFRRELKLPLWAFVISAGLSYSRATAIVGVSVGISNQLKRLLPQYRRKIHTVYNPAYESCQQIVPDIEPMSLLSSCSAKIVLAVGELKAQKNFALLIESMAHLKRSDVILVIIGEGAERAALERLILSFGLTNKVYLPGYSGQVSQWYAVADVFVLSSSWEGFANVIVEALSFGLTIVSTNCISGPSEILAGGEFGVLVPLGDPVLLAEAIGEALNNPFPSEALMARAREYSVDKIANQYLALVDK